MAIGAFWCSVMSVMVKLAGRRLPSMEIVFFRGLFTLALTYMTRGEVLERIGIRRARMIVFAIASHLDEKRGIAVARHLNPRIHIVARTRYVADIEELYNWRRRWRWRPRRCGAARRRRGSPSRNSTCCARELAWRR